MDAMASGYGGTTTTTNIQNPHYPYLPQPQTAIHHLHHPPQHHHLLLHQPQAQAQPPPAAAAIPGVHVAYPPSFPPMQGYPDELRTLFIAGLPGDVKPREIFNLFRDFHGFQTYQIKHSGQSSQAFAFAVFSDQQSAISAMHALNGMEFDLDKGSTLHIDLARSNSRTKRLRTDGGGPPMDKRVKGSVALSRSSEPGIGGINAGLDTAGHNIMNGYPSAHSLSGDNQSAVGLKSSIPSAVPDAPADNPPCPTLFVANLGPACTEEELTQLFIRFPGFLKLKIQRKSGLPVAFVDSGISIADLHILDMVQGCKYDPEGEYVRHWLPELARLPTEWIHHPWDAPASVLRAAGVELGHNYPRPVVDITLARERLMTVISMMDGLDAAAQAAKMNGMDEGVADNSCIVTETNRVPRVLVKRNVSPCSSSQDQKVPTFHTNQGCPDKHHVLVNNGDKVNQTCLEDQCRPGSSRMDEDLKSTAESSSMRKRSISSSECVVPPSYSPCSSNEINRRDPSATGESSSTHSWSGKCDMDADTANKEEYVDAQGSIDCPRPSKRPAALDP